MTKRFTLIITFILAVSQAFAQNGNIKGAVTTADGATAEAVSILVKGTNKGTRTNVSGNYHINNIKPGVQTLVATFIGLEKQEQTVEVKTGETVVLNFTLKESSAQLQEVVIAGRNNARNNELVAKMPLKNLENPQIYNSVSIETIKQQAISNYDDVFRNIPGISRTWQSTGRAGDGGSYFALRGFDAQPALTNGLPGLTAGDLDLADVEEVQVIKGPSATLFGGSFYSYGGLINTITKQPYFTGFGGEVGYNTGSFGLNRLTLDINTPLSKTEKIALRINASAHTEDSFQNAGFKKSFFIAPTLAYQVNDRLKLSVMAQYYNEKRAVAPIFFHSDRVNPLPFKNVKDLNLDYNESFMSNELTMNNPRLNLQAQLVYRLSDKWTSQTVIAHTDVQSNGYYTYIFDDNIVDNFFAQDIHKENQTTKTFNIQQNFNGDFNLFGLRNRLLVGLDYLGNSVRDLGNGYATMRFVTPQNPEVDFQFTQYNPDTEQDELVVYPALRLSKQNVDAALAGTNGSYSYVNRSYGAYASDVINLSPNLMAMLSLRVDRYEAPVDKFSQFALSHKLGLVYQPVIDKVSIFINHMDAFINVQPSAVYDSVGTVIGTRSFKPEHANQWEAGIKTNLFDDKLTATASYYNIDVTNRVYPAADQLNSIQGGKVRSKGFEIDINAHPVQGLSLIAGYSHNDIKILKGAPGDFYNEPGRRPGGQGPSDQVNLWANYKFSKGVLRNFGVGFGGNYAGEYVVIDNSATGVFTLPSYTLLNASAFYNNSRYRIGFNLNNITDKQYYIGYWSINPQTPRNFAVSLAYRLK
ncbi:MAG: TonB-dependent receptor [Sphingobacteriaceae bacterium]|nr:MAG: TonB-dependent receptor [Sphingobacteriaceae bacterium]